MLAVLLSYLLMQPAGAQTPPYTPLVTTTLPAGRGNLNERLLAFNIKADAPGPVLTSITLTLHGTTNPDDLEAVKVSFCGESERYHNDRAILFDKQKPGSGEIRLHGRQILDQGDNWIWITTDLKDDALEGNYIGAKVISYSLGGAESIPVHLASSPRVILLTSTLLFSAGDMGSLSYRIPAIVNAMDGSLVTATDRRWTGSTDLPNHIDVMIRRSTDLGKTWSEPLMIAGKDTETGFGDPALVVNQLNEDIVCLFAAGPGLFQSTADQPIRIFQSVSKDHGVNWNEPREITTQIYGHGCTNPITRNWQAAFISSGAATQLKSGRLMAVMAVREQSDNRISNYVMYSDDNAKTWEVSTHCADPAGDEAKLVELDDGRVLMSIRHRGARWFNISNDQGITWGIPFEKPELLDPFCNGDLVRYSSVNQGAYRSRLLHSIPFADSRRNVSVLLSYDEGATWPVSRSIYDGHSAYSALCSANDGSIGIYFEVGEYDIYQMYFMRFSLNWLTGGTDF